MLMAAILASLPQVSAAASCESLAALSLPQATVEVAQIVAGGPFTLPSPAKGVITDLVMAQCDALDGVKDGLLHAQEKSCIRVSGAAASWVGKGFLEGSASLRTTISTTEGVVDRTRPLCLYPQVARWKGSGSTDQAVNFDCVKEPDK
ncbi:MAG: tannase/feruloyl esterase family alpha/beta hydrolase [Vicinamibacterales bacterium]